MRRIVLLAMAILASCSSGMNDPCAGVVPQSLPEQVDVEPVLAARVPFQDAFVGDGSGSILFMLSDYPLSRQYVGAIYDSRGQLIGTPQGRYADSSHPRPIPLSKGFQLLEGDTINVANLVTYSAAGAPTHTTSVLPAKELISVMDLSGGTLVISYAYVPGAPRARNYPWTISAQRFDADGAPRSPKRVIVSDSVGQFNVGGTAGAVTTSGWTFVAWTTFEDPMPPSADLHGAWMAPDGTVSSTMRFDTTGLGSVFDVQPTIGGGVAIAATIPPFPYSRYKWIAQVRDGETNAGPPSWLDSFPSTRLAIVRDGRAHALLTGVPYWDGAFGADQCQSSVSITLVSVTGKTCGTVSLPVPVDPGLSCNSTMNSAALARDGTAILRNLEYGTNSQGVGQYRHLARWWPQLLK